LALRAILPIKNPDTKPGAEGKAAPQPVDEFLRTVNAKPVRNPDSVEREALAVRVQKALRSFQVLLSCARLYQKNHPRIVAALDTTYDELLSVAGSLSGLEVRVEQKGILVPKLSDTPLPDPRGELAALAADLRRAGIQSLLFARKFHVGELDTFSQLIQSVAARTEENAASPGGTRSWPARLAENRVEGIEANVPKERQMDTVLASLVAALVAFGGGAPRDPEDETPIRPPGINDVLGLLRLLARLTPPLDVARGLSPEDAARALHAALEQADKETVRTLLSAISQHAPRDAERPQPYLLRLSEILLLEFLSAEFAAGALAPSAVAHTVQRLGEELIAGGGYSGPHSSHHLSSLATEWAKETHQEQVIERFWAELTPRERSLTLRGPELWCVPVSALQRALRQLADAGADAPRREARNIILNYVRCLSLPNPESRRAVTVGLGEMTPILESLWPNQLPDDLSRAAMKALEKESVPQIAALLAAFLESLGRIAVTRGDYGGFESILTGLETAPRDTEHDHVQALAQRLVSQDRWLLLVDAALANRALDPVLPRLLQRDPERLLDRLTLLLTETRGQEQVPAMARLLRAIGVPALGLLETRLYEARRQRVMAAIKLLAAADADRLLRALPRALGSWEWNLQDLAVSELARPANAASAVSTAFVFSAILSDAHPLVVPMMIDQIGVAQETTAIAALMEIAAGEQEILRDVFVRIKAIEALGRMRANEAADLLRALAGRRDGLSYAEPAGLRAAAEEALAMIENRPSSARVRAAYETLEQVSQPFQVHRRYTRVPLDSPLTAQIAGPQATAARVRTISMGGAYLQSSRRFAVGDSIKLEIRSGLRKIHSTAVVRNLGPDGGGIEFVHMKEDDREKLRRLVRRHLRD
jgi:hypothetical protein